MVKNSINDLKNGLRKTNIKETSYSLYGQKFNQWVQKWFKKNKYCANLVGVLIGISLTLLHENIKHLTIVKFDGAPKSNLCLEKQEEL